MNDHSSWLIARLFDVNFTNLILPVLTRLSANGNHVSQCKQYQDTPCPRLRRMLSHRRHLPTGLRPAKMAQTCQRGRQARGNEEEYQSPRQRDSQAVPWDRDPRRARGQGRRLFDGLGRRTRQRRSLPSREREIRSSRPTHAHLVESLSAKSTRYSLTFKRSMGLSYVGQDACCLRHARS